MILVDSTIVSVATPTLMAEFETDVNGVLWVTSAYLLAYAVPLLITGRLGDRFGPRPVYLTGLAVFTLASLWCGLSGELGLGLGGLIAARIVQGLGASMMTPQTMTVITRTFPAERRGTAMALWGATAGVATLAGPLLGGVLIDALGWEWIFFVNLPIGLIGWVLAWRLVPRLETHSHAMDLLGVLLSAAGLFAVVFGIQEGQAYDWGTIWRWVSVPLLIGVGVLLMVIFVAWQALNTREPLVPLSLFRDRNFSLANLGITTMGFTITAMIFPFYIWAQSVRGLSPTQAALVMAPSSILSFLLARQAGLLTDRVHPRVLVGSGTALLAVGLWLLSLGMTPTAPLWQALAAAAVLGIANPLIWGPLSTTATRNLPMAGAGAGAGIYNTTRQLGAVLGSSAIAVLMQTRIAAHLPAGGPGAGAMSMPGGGSAGLPPDVAEGISRAMAQSLYLPIGVILLGTLAALFFERPRHLSHREPTATPAQR
ncbi:DHA2 family efflux MFS transporter permease subunit [Ornithinimicrobium ciconiae]|uniref:DHA2 family efflux MFS transporter permease subunit n=2 Tax=Ornithinimicrobium ciconiae TaxID=2594265 RepID=A0A516GFQ8_9MICO|nr:DHA2 family efflux MFS transporter permease subunit [Ornithinimicrobium ciconiae]